MDVKTNSSLTLAAAAAAMFALAPISSSVDSRRSQVCRAPTPASGQSACKTATSECKGLNACQGQGFTMAADEAACMEAGGTVEEG